MSDDKESSGIFKGALGAIFARAPKDVIEFFSFMIGIFIFLGVIAAVSNIPKLFRPSADCWRIQQVEGKPVKLNTCTGETVEIKPGELTAPAITH
ncbi:MAG: hypothetical protein EPN26_17020 [Rhodospirillales bacterium]|nr:MAG: hypothetical protein EPN26_17020 [Rhodospirillales bacterium]